MTSRGVDRPRRTGSPTIPIPRPPPSLRRAPTTNSTSGSHSPLTFGTAGLRGPLRGGPNGMNLAVVLRATWAVAKVLKDRGLGGQDVVVGRDARHGSDEFALAAAEVLAAQGFPVTLMFTAVPTPVVAFAVRHICLRRPASRSPRRTIRRRTTATRCTSTAACRSCRRPTGRSSGRSPTRRTPTRSPARPSNPRASTRFSATSNARPTSGTPTDRCGSRSRRCTASAASSPSMRWCAAGFSDVHVVEDQFAPDPDFPTVAFPNPEEPGAADALLRLAADVDADVAIALDPDADRCAVGIPTPDGWRMLSGDETGWLLGDYILSQIEPGPVAEATVVASSVVSSRMLAAIAAGTRRPSRRDADRVQVAGARRRGLPGCTLVYAYEEAIGHCVDPAAVRDKDGISAAVLVCDLVAALRHRGRTVLDALDDLARRHGVHTTTAVSRPVADADEAAAVMSRLRQAPPARLCRLRRDGDRPAADSGSPPHRRADPVPAATAKPPCGWWCGRRAPSQRSSPTSRFAAAMSAISTRRGPARKRLQDELADAAGAASSAARTDDPRHRRDPARCRRCR